MSNDRRSSVGHYVRIGLSRQVYADGFWSSLGILPDLVIACTRVLQNDTSVTMSEVASISPLVTGRWCSWDGGGLVVAMVLRSVLLENLAAQVDKSFVDIDAPARGGFVVGLGTPMLS